VIDKKATKHTPKPQKRDSKTPFFMGDKLNSMAKPRQTMESTFEE